MLIARGLLTDDHKPGRLIRIEAGTSAGAEVDS